MLGILPTDQALTQADAALAASLRAGSYGDNREQQAALWMLLEQGPEVWADPLVTRHYTPTYGPLNGRRVMWLPLSEAARNLSLPDARGAVLVACSVASHRVHVQLGACLAAMTDVNRARFIEMMRRAGDWS